MTLRDVDDNDVVEDCEAAISVSVVVCRTVLVVRANELCWLDTTLVVTTEVVSELLLKLLILEAELEKIDVVIMVVVGI